MSISEAKVNILSESPSPLSNIKNGYPDFVIWYSFGSTGITARFSGICGMLPSSCAFCMFRLIVAIEGKFAAAFSEILPNCSPRICCTVSSVIFALRFMSTLIFVTSTCGREGACMCSLNCLMNLSVGESFVVARHCPSFLQRIHSVELMSFASIFLNT